MNIEDILGVQYHRIEYVLRDGTGRRVDAKPRDIVTTLPPREWLLRERVKYPHLTMLGSTSITSAEYHRYMQEHGHG